MPAWPAPKTRRHDMKHSIRAAACVAFTAALALTACGGDDDDVPAQQRATAFGTVVGNDDSATTGTYSWKGVPYAKPPVGALRWAAPVDPDAWTTAKTT